MITTIMFILLAVLVSGYIALPVLQSRRGDGVGRPADTNNRASDLEERKNTIYSAIKEIEFDYQMGKLSEEDYQALRQQYKNDAVGLLKRIESVHTQGKGSKKSKRKAGDKPAKFCWVCGTSLIPADRFCPNCGNEIGTAAS